MRCRPPRILSIARLLESALAGLECGADDAELSEALRLLGWPIDAPPSHEVIERLFCECWNALYALGLRPEWIEPEPEPGSGLAPGDLRPERRLQPGDLVPEGEPEPAFR